MSLFDTLKNTISSVKNGLHYSKLLSGRTPVFSQFGNDVYVSDVVQQCMACITDEMRKVQINHILEDKNGMLHIRNTQLNKAFQYQANEYMTPADFMEKATYLLLKNANCFIYPRFVYTYNADGTIKSRDVAALYPLDPRRVDFMQDDAGRMFIRFTFAAGDQFTLPYENIIHWRMHFGANEYLGGNDHGTEEVEDLLNTVRIYDKLMQSLGLAVESSLKITGILKFPMYLGDDKQKDEAERFEKKLRDRNSGIIPMDTKSDYVPIKADPKLIDKDTLEFLDRKILRHFGVSIAVLNGEATPEQHQAFYQRAIEPKLMSLAQAITRTVFTPTEYAFGNSIRIYPEELIFLSTAQKLEFVKMVGERGALTNNKILQLFGLPPYEGGDVRLQSLNYVDVEIANEYQLANAGSSAVKKGLTVNE